uniref:ATPase subunit 8 n=1 Tax=Physomerus sp. TaxID=2931302 RepID=A0A8T9ZYI6_9HEMI|nr:ATPase subunit 8 [Physomerus sp.]
MPQMSPLSWEILFTIFLMSFIIMNMIMYHNKMMIPKQLKIKVCVINQLKWKW